jgi:hypothetical protein
MCKQGEQMKKSNVVNMATVRELLLQLDQIRADVLAGDIAGWGGMVKHTDGTEVVYLGGTFRYSSADRTRCVLRVSAAVALNDTYLPPPPPRQAF